MELMYGELAPWWPLLSPAEDYADEASFATTLLRTADRPVREVLELGSGGGSVASHLADEFTMTLTDLAEPMLAASRVLNPGMTHVQGDMRDVRLAGDFDAIFVHDAITYMRTEDDLTAAMTTAYVHCRPGGVAVFVPDHVADSFESTTDYGGSDDDSGRGARFLLWTTDADPDDGLYEMHVSYLLRHADGTVEAHHETHRHGLFPRETWQRLLTEAGFEVDIVAEVTTEDRAGRDFLVGRRPA